MEANRAKKEKKEKEHKSYIYDENGRREFIYPEPKRLSPFGAWMKEHPDGSIMDYWTATRNK
ncbi:hypothetical protein Barb6XT_01389 [Bacteroidales bacterium Barb6XT]|nr:hypothetical protein Barb6XT_01389 [Bacteroidales bacterium Barb6XT]